MERRIFIGIKINLSDKLVNLISNLKLSLTNSDIKWVDMNNLHITLMFLGDVDTKKIPDIIQKLKCTAKLVKPFSIKLVGFGKFSRQNKTSVIWVGFTDKSKLQDIAEKIKRSMIELDFEKEDRPFSPHLTVGRVKTFCNEEKLNNFIKLNIQTNLQESAIKDFILFESILKPTGPIYKPIECFSI